MAVQTRPTSATTSAAIPVRWLLHLEGAALAVGSLALYLGYTGAPWWWIPALFLVPDLAFGFYALSPAAATIAYNVVHHLALPTALAIVALATGWTFGVALALIWVFHIGLDRALGYGFKYNIHSKDTHITRA